MDYQDPVRETITRRQHGFRAKFPSNKMGKMIRCESLLERDAARYFEFNPLVLAYYSQPIVFHYYDDDMHAHVYRPDFLAVWQDKTSTTFEVKPAAKLLDAKIRRKFALIAKRFEALEKPFHILTDEFLRAGPLASNLTLLASKRGQVRAHKELKLCLAGLTDVGTITLHELGERLGGPDKALIAISSGLVSINLLSRIELTNPVEFSEVAQ